MHVHGSAGFQIVYTFLLGLNFMRMHVHVWYARNHGVRRMHALECMQTVHAHKYESACAHTTTRWHQHVGCDSTWGLWRVYATRWLIPSREPMCGGIACDALLDV